MEFEVEFFEAKILLRPIILIIAIISWNCKAHIVIRASWAVNDKNL